MTTHRKTKSVEDVNPRKAQRSRRDTDADVIVVKDVIVIPDDDADDDVVVVTKKSNALATAEIIAEAALYMLQYFIWTYQFRDYEHLSETQTMIIENITKLGGPENKAVKRFESHVGMTARKFAHHTLCVFRPRFDYGSLVSDILNHGDLEGLFADMCKYEEELERKHMLEADRANKKHKQEMQELRQFATTLTQITHTQEQSDDDE
jgi:hypothetical protein